MKNVNKKLCPFYFFSPFTFHQVNSRALNIIDGIKDSRRVRNGKGLVRTPRVYY